MAKMIVMSVFVAAALWHAPALHAADEYYVQSVKAKVMSGATFKSAVLGEVDKGHKFISSGKEGEWIKVKYNNGDGYVHSFVLLMHPPVEDTMAVTGEEEALRKGFRRRASSSTGAEAESGLDRDEGKGKGKGKGRGRFDHADYESLEKIELFTISSWEVKRFMEGKE
jgi:hypothetical protein